MAGLQAVFGRLGVPLGHQAAAASPGCSIISLAGLLDRFRRALQVPDAFTSNHVVHRG